MSPVEISGSSLRVWIQLTIDQVQHVSTDSDGRAVGRGSLYFMASAFAGSCCIAPAGCQQTAYLPATYYNFADMMQEEIRKIVNGERNKVKGEG